MTDLHALHQARDARRLEEVEARLSERANTGQIQLRADGLWLAFRLRGALKRIEDLEAARKQ